MLRLEIRKKKKQNANHEENKILQHLLSERSWDSYLALHVHLDNLQKVL